MLGVKIDTGRGGWCWVRLRRLALGVKDGVRCGRQYWMRLLVLGKGGHVVRTSSWGDVVDCPGDRYIIQYV